MLGFCCIFTDVKKLEESSSVNILSSMYCFLQSEDYITGNSHLPGGESHDHFLLFFVAAAQAVGWPLSSELVY